MKRLEDINLAVIGLGYVGLPLAVEFGKFRSVIGYDIDEARVQQIKLGSDITKELSKDQISEATKLIVTNDPNDLSVANTYIITVPTPVDKNRVPDLDPVLSATKLISKHLQPGDLVIYESTVYPGLTEDVCGPLISSICGLQQDDGTAQTNVFYLGYSPERINPGDPDKKIYDIVKVTSGSSPLVAHLVDDLYSSIVTAGTHMAPTIKTAEAAKVIENIQRDVNIALINELSQIFEGMKLDTLEVLTAAQTKWNFLPFKPGLVGGHCIGVDPYYLTYKASELGYHPDTILAARRINESMPEFVAKVFIKLLTKKKINIPKAKVLILGLSFKENCPDIRNSKVYDLIRSLRGYGVLIDAFDPIAFSSEFYSEEADFEHIIEPKADFYDGIILAVPHEYFKMLGIRKIREMGKNNHIFYDLKAVFKKTESDGRL